MSNLVKQAGLLSAADFSRLAIKAFIGFILARLFSITDYGTYRQLFMVYSIFSTMMLLGLPQSILYFLPKLQDEEKRGQFIRQTLYLFLVMGVVLGLLLFFFRHQLSVQFHNPALEVLLLLFAMYPVLMFVTTFYNFYMLGSQNPLAVAKFTIFSVISDALLIIGTALFTHNLFYTTIAILVSSFIQFSYAQFHVGWKNIGHFHLDRELLKEQFAFSAPLGLASMVGMLAIQIDKLVISSYYSPEIFAVFSVGAMEVPFIGIVLNAVNSVLMPELAKRDVHTEKAEISVLYRGAVRKNALIILPMFAFLFVFAQDFIVMLYSARYVNATVFFRIYLLSMPLRIATYGVLLQIGGKTKYVFYSAVVSLIMNVIMNLIFIHTIGQQGPAWATVIVIYLGVAFYLWLIRKVMQYRMRLLFPLPDLFKTLLVSLVCGGLTAPLLLWHLNPWFRLPLGVIAFTLLYLVLGSLSGVIKPYDRELILSILGGLWQRVQQLRHTKKGTETA
jgi:O-antigen/teichoic acid export membrane protein